MSEHVFILVATVFIVLCFVTGSSALGAKISGKQEKPHILWLPHSYDLFTVLVCLTGLFFAFFDKHLETIARLEFGCAAIIFLIICFYRVRQKPEDAEE